MYPLRTLEVIYTFGSLNNNRIPKIERSLSDLEQGARYNFEVVTVSDGEDQTESAKVQTSQIISSKICFEIE